MSSRKSLLFNKGAVSINVHDDVSLPRSFHCQMPDFAVTPLVSMESLAKKLDVKAVYVKDESNRLGLPSFKILGASWGTCRAIIDQFDLPLNSSFQDIARCAQQNSIVLYTASAGNHGRALAATARFLGIQSKVYVFKAVGPAAAEHIASEGAEVVVSQLDYDGAMREAHAASKTDPSGLFVQDAAFDGYTDIPKWIVEGYATLVAEVDAQLALQGLKPNLVVTPCGVGSLAQAVVRHCKSGDRAYRVLAVEPDTAACLYESLRQGKIASVATSKTIMEGLNCGTVSLTAFNDLRSGVDACVTVSDHEAHEATRVLEEGGINSGPCGGATLAGLHRLAESDQRPSWLTADSVVVVLNTESSRHHEKPLDVAVEDATGLTQILTRIASANPDLSNDAGSDETVIAEYIFSWLRHRDLEAHWVERTAGRPSIVGVLRGTGGGKSLMLNGHIDTVSLSSYGEGTDPLSGLLQDNRIYGRGSLDMKAGVASSMAVLAALAKSGAEKLRGDILLAAVSDEENFSKGTEDVLAAGWRADAALILEPTGQAMVTAHRGFVWVEIDVLGKAAHGSEPHIGIDAILLAGSLQTALLEYGRTLPTHPLLGKAHLHGGKLVGGEEPSSYPAKCTLTIEFRTVPPQTPSSIMDDLNRILGEVAAKTPDFRYAAPRMTFARPGSALEDDHSFVQTVRTVVGNVTGHVPAPGAAGFWCDAGLFETRRGIPIICPREQPSSLAARSNMLGETRQIGLRTP
ncbi:diaminopropionate ammonia-lyase [Verticillium alfalfae VaMs.102]|uniref:Diaminopropionate ammonia-lyase n=1 Tax=Verticillium alfalfae (strain VaMs.102 / ATCC MYA-4576 / FGSC 10136) TaxID=526221 RepID=C9S5X2_VERA1|nr:diaminopropionate ammonia-lyase [Verticillium alfalfae VaMs.102]EEY15111.1 diaminopropionate ammonia-lyase [Verticillium alfalfae VaMs.102]